MENIRKVYFLGTTPPRPGCNYRRDTVAMIGVFYAQTEKRSDICSKYKAFSISNQVMGRTTGKSRSAHIILIAEAGKKDFSDKRDRFLPAPVKNSNQMFFERK